MNRLFIYTTYLDYAVSENIAGKVNQDRFVLSGQKLLWVSKACIPDTFSNMAILRVMLVHGTSRSVETIGGFMHGFKPPNTTQYLQMDWYGRKFVQ